MIFYDAVDHLAVHVFVFCILTWIRFTSQLPPEKASHITRPTSSNSIPYQSRSLLKSSSRFLSRRSNYKSFVRSFLRLFLFFLLFVLFCSHFNVFIELNYKLPIDWLISEFHALACRFLLIYVTKFPNEKKNWINSFQWQMKWNETEKNAARCATITIGGALKAKLRTHGLFLEMWSGWGELCTRKQLKAFVSARHSIFAPAGYNILYALKSFDLFSQFFSLSRLLIYLKRPFLCLLTACIFNKEKNSSHKNRVQYGFWLRLATQWRGGSEAAALSGNTISQSGERKKNFLK